MQDRELTQQIEKFIEVIDMELEHETHNEYTDLMPREPQVISQSPPPVVSEQASSEQGDVFLLDDDPVRDVYNLSFDELQMNIVHAQRNNFPYDHASPAFIMERVIVSDTRKHPTTLAEANFAYSREKSSNVKYPMNQNEKIEKNLQAAKQELEQL